MYKQINNFLFEIIPSAFIKSIIIGILLGLIFGVESVKPFILGTALSFLSFTLLTLSTYIIISFSSDKARNLYTLFFIVRNLIIAIVVYLYARDNVHSIIFVIIGITMVLFSIKINAFVKHYTTRKESKNGRNKSCI